MSIESINNQDGGEDARNKLNEVISTANKQHIFAADRWKVKISDPTEWSNTHEGFGGIAEFPDETIGIMARVGSRHNLSEAPLYFIRSLDPYGYEWGQKIEVDNMAGHDIRNGCVGSGINGDIMGLFQNRQVSPALTLDPALYFSTDGGNTWTKQVHDLAMVPHGNIIELPTRYLGTGYAGSLEYMRIVEISKDFSSVNIIKEYDSDDFDSGLEPTDFQISEGCIVKISDTVIFGTIRNQTPPGAIMQFYSEDGGHTWSDIYATNIFAGATPHLLYNDGLFIYAFFPARIGDIHSSLPAPSLEGYGQNYMLTYKPVSKITDMESGWNFPTPLFPIPPHGSNSNGDVERGHLFKRDGSLHLMWKQGTYMDSSDGESVQWIKNIGRYS